MDQVVISLRVIGVQGWRAIRAIARAAWEAMPLVILIGVIEDISLHPRPDNSRWFAQYMLLSIGARWMFRLLCKDVLGSINVVRTGKES